jgi:hypothetical protein
MKKTVLFLFAVAGTCVALACTPATSGDSAAGPAALHTTQEIMQSMVAPQSDILWNAVSISASEKGIEMTAPGTAEEWAAVRHAAVSVTEAMNLIVMADRRIGPPGAQAKDPKAELGPEQIEALIKQDRASWDKMARELQDAIAPAIKAIDAKDAEGLSKAGEGLSTACGNCHQKFWYPNQKRQN